MCVAVSAHVQRVSVPQGPGIIELGAAETPLILTSFTIICGGGEEGSRAFFADSTR